jgi:hypothetical protein
MILDVGGKEVANAADVRKALAEARKDGKHSVLTSEFCPWWKVYRAKLRGRAKCPSLHLPISGFRLMFPAPVGKRAAVIPHMRILLTGLASALASIWKLPSPSSAPKTARV